MGQGQKWVIFPVFINSIVFPVASLGLGFNEIPLFPLWWQPPRSLLLLSQVLAPNCLVLQETCTPGWRSARGKPGQGRERLAQPAAVAARLTF